MDRDSSCSVRGCWTTDGLDVDFRRSLSPHEWQNWLGLVNDLQPISLANRPDSISSVLELDRSKQFATKSLYRFLTDMGLTSRIVGILWKCKIPLKSKFFLRQVFNNSLQVAQCLVKRSWKENGKCWLCGNFETIDHVLFHCHLAICLGGILREVFKRDHTPFALDFIASWLQGKGPLPSRLLKF